MLPAAPRPTPLRAFLHASFILWLARRDALIELWHGGDPLVRLAVRRLEVDHTLEALREWARILLARYLLIPARQRRRFKGRLKLAILLYGQRFNLPWAEVARDFGLKPSALYRWLRRRRTQGGSSLLRDYAPAPPIRRFADAVRALVADMKLAGFPGDGSIAGALLAQGVRISHDTIGRILLGLGFARPPRRRRAGKTRRPSRKPAARRQTAHATLESHTRMKRLARAFVAARELLGLHLGDAVARSRRWLPHTRERRETDLRRLRARYAEQIRILHQHLGQIDPRKRPLYTPELRLAILAFKYRYRLSHEKLARRFLVHPNTICEWNVRADEDPPPPLLAPSPKLRSAEPAVGRALAFVPRLRHDLRARLLAVLLTLCTGIPARSRRQRVTKPIELAARPGRRRRTQAPTVALYPNHHWLADFTVFWQQERPDLYLLVFLDAYSRRRTAFRLFLGEPSAEQTAQLLRKAVTAHGKPKHFISDRGAEFTAEVFRLALGDLGVEPHIGHLYQPGGLPIIERLWLTTKTTLDTYTSPPLVPDIFAEQLGAFMDWYDHHRPHSSLGFRTPAQAFTGQHSPAPEAKSPPRGRPAEPCEPLGLRIRFALEGDRLPYLDRVAYPAAAAEHSVADSPDPPHSTDFRARITSPCQTPFCIPFRALFLVHETPRAPRLAVAFPIA